MFRHTAKRAPGLMLPLLVAALAACGDADEAQPELVEEEVVVVEPTPRERLQSAVDVWNTTRSFHFTLLLENRTIALDEAGMLSYTDVSGDVVAPDRLQAETLVRTPVGNAQVAFVGIGDRQWITNPLTRQWEAAPPEAASAVAEMFDPSSGIGAMLVGMDTVEVVGEEALDGVPMRRLRGGLPGSVLGGFAPDLAAVARLEVDLLAGVEDNRIRQIVVRQPPAGEVTPTWTFNFSNFDLPVTIEPPL